jgi:hypothetical protein
VADFASSFGAVQEANLARLIKYGHTFTARDVADLEAIKWDLLDGIPEEELFLAVSFNPNNCRMELDYFKVKEEVFRELNYGARVGCKHITEVLKQSDGALYAFSIFLSPSLEDEGGVNWRDCDAYKERLASFKQFYPSKYEPFLVEVMPKIPKSVRIICNCAAVSNALMYYGWDNVRTRETKFIEC